MKTLNQLLIFLPMLFFSIQSNAGAPLKGIDVKLGRNPGGGCAARATSDENGNFSVQLPEGEYWIQLEVKQVKSSVAETIKTKYPQSSAYKFDGKGISMALKSSSKISSSSQRKSGSIIVVDFEEDGKVIVTIPKGGATLSGILNWDDTPVIQEAAKVKSHSNQTNN